MIDLDISRYFYSPQGFTDNGFTQVMYTWGVIPGLILTFGAFLVFLTSFGMKTFKPYRKEALYLFVSIFVGSVIVVHAFFKDHIERPRPREVTQFGGQATFRAVYEPKITLSRSPHKSFSCGHCTMGFCFFSLAYIFQYRKNQKAYLLTLLFALSLGGTLSLTRIAQGGHFFSDVIVSMVVMWISAKYFTSFLR